MYKSMKEALAMKDDAKLSNILDKLNIDDLTGKKSKEKRRTLLVESKEGEDDDDDDEHKNDNSASDSAEKLKQFVAKMTENLPDPIVS